MISVFWKTELKADELISQPLSPTVISSEALNLNNLGNTFIWFLIVRVWYF